MKNRILIAALAGLFLCAGFAVAGWSEQPSGVSVSLYDIECVGPNLAWAVGAAGTIVHTTNGGQNWSAQPSGTSEDLYAVDFVDSLNGWVAGYGPVILRTSDAGANWAAQPAGTSNDLLGIAFADLSRGWAAGVSGTVIGTTNGGASWASEVSGLWGWYRGIAVASAASAWVIGADWFNHVSPIYHYDGARWSHQYDITRNQNGQDVSVADGNFVWAVADSGTISHSTNAGANWATQNSGTTVLLNAVSAVSAEYCWAVGASGTILATSDGGANWGSEASGITGELYGIAMLDSERGWTCGAFGKILRRTGAQAVEEGTPDAVFGRAGTIVRNELRLRRGFAGEVRVYDASGRQVRSVRVGAAEAEPVIPLDGLRPGAYFASVEVPGRREVARFVKVD